MQKNRELKDSGHYQSNPEASASGAMPGPGWPARHPGYDGKPYENKHFWNRI